MNFLYIFPFEAALCFGAAYAGSKYGSKAGVAVAAVEARVKTLEASAAAKVESVVKAVEAKI